jgi:hypothetical protein
MTAKAQAPANTEPKNPASPWRRFCRTLYPALPPAPRPPTRPLPPLLSVRRDDMERRVRSIVTDGAACPLHCD